MNLLAQLATDAAPFAQQGILGAIIAWLAVRLEKKVESMRSTLVDLSMAIMMDLSSRKVLGPIAQKIVDSRLAKMGITPEDSSAL